MDGKERAFRVESAFWRILQEAARRHEARLVLVDLGPNLGALNRAALLTADFVVVPLAPDLFSVKGLTNLGPTLRRWRTEWVERRTRNPESKLALPSGRMEPAGYVVLQHAIRLDRPTRAYDRWMQRIPVEYRRIVLDEGAPLAANTDHCLARLKHYRSLMPMAQEARKPIFFLKAADGALGHTSRRCRRPTATSSTWRVAWPNALPCRCPNEPALSAGGPSRLGTASAALRTSG